MTHVPHTNPQSPEAKRAAEMYVEGFSQNQIAAAIGRSRKAVRTALRQLGVETRTPAEGWSEYLKRRSAWTSPL